MQTTESKPSREGWVYLIRANGTRRYKIGRSANPAARHQVLQNQSPFPLEISLTFWSIDAVKDEAELHQHFEKYRVFGEWFDFSEDFDQVIDELFSLFTYPDWIRRQSRESMGCLIHSRIFKDFGPDDRPSKLLEGCKRPLYQLYKSCASYNELELAQNSFKELVKYLESVIEPRTPVKEIESTCLGAIYGLVARHLQGKNNG